ncbi:AGAP010426-PA-like protein [Anopheles sinensis]|uniref:AGAP010426-PA-like protein n=1 Tax=Anopheles sinensis TaxID=74873 RepID=A0A084VTQ7_ANOSI|nr:AGAP010426-PA-like protein [Anopheles sinensis]
MSFNNSDYDSSNVEIEEFEVDEVDASELTEFIELPCETVAKLPKARGGPSTSSAKAYCTTASESDTDDERVQQREILLKKLVAREITYSEYQERLPDDELDEEDGYLELAKQQKRANYENDYASARMDAFRGNLQGSSPTESKRRRRKNLPPALQGLMGEANLCFARGDMKTAKDLCLEIIRQVPLAHEPFITLAQIYETEDPEQYLHYSFIAAHLNPTDVSQWTQVAELCVERGKIDLALTCYTRALKTDPKNVEIRLKRAQLAESRGDAKQAYRYYYGMLPYIPQEQGDLMISTAKKVAKKFSEETNIGAALDAMQIAYSTVPDKFSTEDINVLLELLISNGLYRRALDILTIHAGVEVVETGSDMVSREEPKPMVMVTIPDEIMLDFRTKLAVVLVHLKYEHLFEHLLEDVVMYIDPESDGDCYLDIAEALMKEQYYRFALRMLEPLIRSRKFSLAAVWLRYADCSRHVEENEKAIAAYRQVVSLAQHLDARLALAALLKKRGDYDEALEALKQDPDLEYLDPEVLYERCLLLEEVGHYREFLAEGFMLLARHCYELKNRYEMDTVVLGFRMYTSRLGDLKIRNIGEGAPAFSTTNDLSLETEWDLVLRLVKAADHLRDYTFFMKLVFTLRTSKRYERYRNELQQLALTACIYNRDPTFGLNIIRDQIRAIVVTQSAKLNQSHLWNLFNLVILISGDARYQRYLSRLFKRVPGIGIYPKTLLANYHLNSTTYKYALNEYNKIYNKTKDPLIAMLIAVTLLQIASQKYSTKKHSLLAQANVFMEKYRQGRPDELQHEVWYNYGRLYHQLGMHHLATDYYKRVLHFDSEVVRENPQHLCLKAEAAYNLCSIYKQSGNLELARKYMYDYLQV